MFSSAQFCSSPLPPSSNALSLSIYLSLSLSLSLYHSPSLFSLSLFSDSLREGRGKSISELRGRVGVYYVI